MKTVGLTINKDCLVSNPSIHDGLLQGICLEGDRSCRVRFKSSSGERIEFILHKVRNLKANDFFEGNIVGEMFAFIGKQIPVKKLEQLLFAGLPLETAYLERVKMECHDFELLFFEIEPSYGCKLQVLCESIECVRYPD